MTTAAVRFVALSLLAAGAAASAWAAQPLMEGTAVGAPPPAPWHVVGLPQQTKPFTQFSVVDLDGQHAFRIEAVESYGNLFYPLKSVPPNPSLTWKWRVELPLLTADLREKQGDDNAVKVCVFFDEPIEKASFAERQLLRYARGRTTDPVPVATVCYVWDAKLAQGTTLDNAFTRRQRYMVLESGAARLNQWVPERRDLGADFLKLFGDEMDSVPAITGIAVGADADNTKSHSISYVGSLVLEP
jgi:Protein of unknown function (DUF3047)